MHRYIVVPQRSLAQSTFKINGFGAQPYILDMGVRRTTKRGTIVQYAQILYSVPFAMPIPKSILLLHLVFHAGEQN